MALETGIASSDLTADRRVLSVSIPGTGGSCFSPFRLCSLAGWGDGLPRGGMLGGKSCPAAAEGVYSLSAQ